MQRNDRIDAKEAAHGQGRVLQQACAQAHQQSHTHRTVSVLVSTYQPTNKLNLTRLHIEAAPHPIINGTRRTSPYERSKVLRIRSSTELVGHLLTKDPKGTLLHIPKCTSPHTLSTNPPESLIHRVVIIHLQGRLNAHGIHTESHSRSFTLTHDHSSLNAGTS